ncbi:ribosomal protein S19 family protein [Candidatus Pacearchaeota archaeon]|nr:ribosomal protein S19 family protein [Candidatus Pacearchaeota archaeon]
MAGEVTIRLRERKFCGLTLEQLKEFSLTELSNYVPARSRRSLLRHPEIVEKFLKAVDDKIARNKKIRTHLRDLIIVPKMVGLNVGVYNGKSFQELQIEIEMIGHRLGEFALTRQKVNHSAAGIGATRGSKSVKK